MVERENFRNNGNFAKVLSYFWGGMDVSCFQNSWVTGTQDTHTNASVDWASHMCSVSSQLGRKWFCQICWSDSNVAMGLKFCWSCISFITKVFSLYLVYCDLFYDFSVLKRGLHFAQHFRCPILNIKNHKQIATCFKHHNH